MTAFIVLCASIGYGVESIFGFGGSVVTYLLLTLNLTAKQAISILPIFALAGSLFIIISDWRAIKWTVIRRVVLIALPGMLIGILVMDKMPETALALAVLIFIFVYGVMQSFGRDPVFPKGSQIPFYLISGFVMGASSLGVMFVPVLGSELGDRRSFRVSLGLLWFLTASVRVPLYYVTGNLDTSGFISGLWAIPFLLVSIYVGFKIHKIIPEASYKRFVGVAITAISLIKLVMLIPSMG